MSSWCILQGHYPLKGVTSARGRYTFFDTENRLIAYKPKEIAMAGKFVLKKTKVGNFVFNLKASNGQNILKSEPYKSKRAALEDTTVK